jgi:molybdate transport system ATP-binding protein
VSAPVFDIDLQLRRGTFACRLALRSPARVVALTGPSGSGKSSVLHAIAGLLRPLDGRIAIAGRVLFDHAARIDLPAHRRRIGYVFQDARLFPHLDVRGNLGYAMPRDAGGFGFDDVVDLLGLGGLLARRTAGLSGGEAQRVALGRALLSQPQALLLDEPLSMLDLDRRDELLAWLVRVRDAVALPMVYVSHLPDEVARIADEVYRLPALQDRPARQRGS